MGEYELIIKGSNEYSKFYYLQIDGDEHLPIFISRNDQEVKQFVEQHFVIFADRLNEYAAQSMLYISAKSKNATTTATKTIAEANTNNVVDINM